jgi:hypothetical protein
MNVRAIKTAESQNAVNEIKMITKREVVNISTKVPKELVQIRMYMQSDEYIKDTRNRMFYNIVNDMMNCRDNIVNEINDINTVLKGQAVQGINGFLRLQKEIAKDFNINFDNEPTIHTMFQSKYKQLKDSIHELVNHY